MGKPGKKEIRDAFRKAVFARDGFRCAMCGRSDVKLDAHHIMDRHDMPNGGYVLENGITLCDCENGCHWKAEQWHATGTPYPGYSPDELFARIGSDLDRAIEASRCLTPGSS
jgi:5-methylcytosine-specific restriction endonuclease McrA